jgi:N,N'-diacetyllegionaminate synthase
MKTLIIAEAGVNHNGDINFAKQLIAAAAAAGADIVKFQTFKANNLVTKTASKAAYQNKTTDET